MVENFRLFLVIFARVIALVLTAPLLSSEAIPRLAKVGLAIFVSTAVMPLVAAQGYTFPGNTVDYFLLVVGEVLIGVILGFFLNIIFAAFQLAGQFFSLQVGFGASEVFDPLAQIEIPLMGQLFNLVGMLTFLMISGAQKLVLVGVYRSFESVRAFDLVAGRQVLLPAFLRSLGRLFTDALTISFPILGTLVLISVAMGLLAKAAPQMNLLMMGFSVSILVTLLILFLGMPFFVGVFSRFIDDGLQNLAGLLSGLQGAGK
jgi:flagellar biosynthetic protein FliR